MRLDELSIQEFSKLEGSLFDSKSKNKFLNGINKTDHCWIWNRAKNTEGYGYIVTNLGYFRTHRMSYLIFNGNFEENKVICHSCDNPSCVNPYHLFQATKGDNNRDRASKGRGRDQRGAKNNMVKLNKEIVMKILQDLDSQSKIGKKYNVSQRLISKIKKGLIWRDVYNDYIEKHTIGV